MPAHSRNLDRELPISLFTARKGGASCIAPPTLDALVTHGKFFFADVYVIGMYFSERTTSAEAAIDSAGPKRIALTFMRDVKAESLVDALYEGVRDSSGEAEFTAMKASADALSAIMLPLRVAKKGDIVALDYLPDAGAQVVVNGRVVGRPVPDRNLYRALRRIWLGDAPVDAKLKRALLLGRT